MEKQLQRLRKEVNALSENCWKLEGELERSLEASERRRVRMEGTQRLREVDLLNLRRQMQSLWFFGGQIEKDTKKDLTRMQEQLTREMKTIQEQIEELKEKFMVMEEHKKKEKDELKTRLEKWEEWRKAVDKHLATKGSALEPTSTEKTSIVRQQAENDIVRVSDRATVPSNISPQIGSSSSVPSVKGAKSTSRRKCQDVVETSKGTIVPIPSSNTKAPIKIKATPAVPPSSDKRLKLTLPDKKTHRLLSPEEKNVALILAAASGSSTDVKHLLETGADVRAKNIQGFTALHLACKGGHFSVVAQLLDARSFAGSSGNGGLTPLHCAAIHGHHEVATLLILQRTDVNCTTMFGETPLHCAVANDRELLVGILVANGADLKVVNGRGQAPIDLVKSDAVRRILELAQRYFAEG